MSDLATIAIALAGGAVGQAAGKSPVTGDKPWNKVLAPAGAVLAAVLYKKFGGGELTDEQAASAGLMIGASAVGVYSASKNLVQMVKTFFKKGPK